MIDWKKELGKNSCYKNFYGYSDISDIPNCLSIIPEEIDTPILKEIREKIEECGGRPSYPGMEIDRIGDAIKMKKLVIGKKTDYGSANPEDILRYVKSRIRWMVNDFPWHLIQQCNQRIEIEPIPGGTEYQTRETGNIVNNEGKQLCQVSNDILWFRDIGRELEKEEWDYKAMSGKIKDLAHKNWVEQNAWDLTQDELKDVDIDERLGFKK